MRRIGSSLGMVFLLSFASVAAAPPPLPPTGGVRIEALTHDATRALTAGDSITVTLRGSAGGTAAFSIPEVVTDVSMQEVRTGVYQAQPALYIGKYTIQNGDNARNATVVATLQVRGQEVLAASGRSVTIATSPPFITSVHPVSGAIVTNNRPNIAIHFFDAVSGVNPRTVRILVNGRDVSARASVTDTTASYSPDAALPPGPVRVQVSLANQSKNTVSRQWTFTVAPSDGLIQSVTINPTTALKLGDVLSVAMTGIPGGSAAFAIEGHTGTIQMRESRTAGVYFGSYVVGAGPPVVDAPLVVTLVRAGRQSTATSTIGLTILPALPPPPMVRPARSEVTLGKSNAVKLVLDGRSQPGYRILGGIMLTGRSLSGEEPSPLGEFLTMAAGDGSWRNTINVPILGGKLVVSVIALDPAGQRSRPTVVEVP